MSKKYIGLIFYDMNMQSKANKKAYLRFLKELDRNGYYKIQNSIYATKSNGKDKLNTQIKYFKEISPNDSNIRMLILTKKQFKEIICISSELSFYEKILSQDEIILEL